MLYISVLYCTACVGQGGPVDGHDAGIGVEDPYPEDEEQSVAIGRRVQGRGDIMYQQIKCVFLESIECQWRNAWRPGPCVM